MTIKMALSVADRPGSCAEVTKNSALSTLARDHRRSAADKKLIYRNSYLVMFKACAALR